MFEKGIAIFASIVAVVAYYGFQITHGYARTNYFPVLVDLTSSPNCAHCDLISRHFPLIEVAILSALLYGVLFDSETLPAEKRVIFFPGCTRVPYKTGLSLKLP